MRGATLETLLLAVLAGFSALFLFLTKDYGATAALFPRVVASATLAFLALDLLWQYLVVGKRSVKPKAKALDETANKYWLLPLALQAGYMGLIHVAGFSAATLVYLIACPWQLSYRNWIITILHAVLLTFVIVYTFHSVFHVRLPEGMLGIPW
ncbi:MAG: tripartite tricarboxylate transporter TctB family protein [Chloroflexota bacterium]